MAELTELGVKCYGGCCGTTPEYIRLLAQAVSDRTVPNLPRTVPAAVCSGTQTVPIDRVRVIGERLNPTGKKRMKQALLDGDVDYMLDQALEQMASSFVEQLQSVMGTELKNLGAALEQASQTQVSGAENNKALLEAVSDLAESNRHMQENMAHMLKQQEQLAEDELENCESR